MSKTYKVLWLDDRPTPLMNDMALLHGITIVHFRSNDDGFSYLNQHYAEVDAVILDAISFQHRWQEAGTESIKALDEAKERLAELRPKKDLPWFILSGQMRLKSEQDSTGRYDNFYTKSEDEGRLFTDLKRQVDQQVERQIRYKYASAFAACTEQLLGQESHNRLLKVLQNIDSPQPNHDDDQLFNALRQLVEAFLYTAHKNRLLPDQCLKSPEEINLTSASMFMSSKQVNPPQGGTSVKPLNNQKVLPAVLAASLSNLIELTNNGSHYQGDTNVSPKQRSSTKRKLQELRQHVRTPYLLAALTFQLLDLLVWLCSVINNATELNRLQDAWEPVITAGSSAHVSGVVTHINPTRSAGTFTAVGGRSAHIHSSTLADTSLNLQVGSKIEAVLGPNNNAPPGGLPEVVKSVKLLQA